MRSISIRSWSVFALAFAAGCGSESALAPASGPNGNGNGADAGVDAGGRPGAMPCDIHSGYDGDEFCIQPPDPSLGFQLHYGPKDYQDPDEVARYVLMPGQETTDCVFMKTPNEVEIFHSEYHGRMRPGSHHMLVFTRSSEAADSVGPEACNQGLDTAMILGAQTPTIDIDRSQNPAPENDGLAQKLTPRAQAVFQLHYLNSSAKPMLREAWVNVIYRDASTVKVLSDPIFFLAGLAANIPPATTKITKGQAVAPQDVRLVAATGHYHAHTVRFSAFSVIGGERKQILEDYDWHEPTMFTYDTVLTNPLWNPSEKKAGASSGVLNLAAGDRIEWECEVVNDGNVPLRFGDAVYTGEMCNMFGYYAPTTGRPWSASNF
ncbi:MAG TPA: hypothetical protein VK550_14995 [Polyangiaceae bacterium]|nr:hypothetical protein [Polyangiaceae bacterium]